MAFGLDLWIDVKEALVRPYDEGCALDAGDEFSVHVLWLDHVEVLADRLVGVCEQGVGQAVFFLKLLLRFNGVAGDAKDDDASILKLLEVVAKAAGFDGAARGVGFGIEEEDDGLADEVGEVDGVAVLVGEGEVLDVVADLHACLLMLRSIVRGTLPPTHLLPGVKVY